MAWKRSKADPPKYSKLECGQFAGQLIANWGLNPKHRYRSYGHLVQYEKKPMLLFSFEDPEVWDGKALVKDHE